MTRTSMTYVVLIVAAATLVSGCGIPRDIRGTTDEVLARGHIRAGAIAGASTLDLAGAEPNGFEADAVRGYADTLGVDVEWRSASEQELMRMLEDGELDLVVGGLEPGTPWKARAGLSVPLGEGERTVVVAVRKGENRFLLGLDQYLERPGTT